MVCEFLPKEFKDRLVEMASVEDLVAAGYTPKSASNVKSHKIISDERCDRLVEILGERAHPVLREAFQAFAAELSGLGIPLDSQAQQPAALDKKTVKEAVREVFEEYFGRPKTEKDLDRVYEQVKDSLGMTTVEILRQQLGMTLEQFLARFRDYLLQHYELHPGGKEGIVLGGVMHGVIRRKS